MVKHFHTTQTSNFELRERAISQEYVGKLIQQNSRYEKATSYVSDFWQPWVRPPVDFIKCLEYYYTIGKVQNTVDSLIGKVLARDWYYYSDIQSDIDSMNKWEQDFNGSWLLEEILRNWAICGTTIIGFNDWLPMQLSTVLGVRRNLDGEILYIVQQINGVINYLDYKNFVKEDFIQTDRQAWGRGLFTSLMQGYTDIDGRPAIPIIENYRQMLADMAKIYHKFASPRVVWTFEGAGKQEIDEHIAPLIGSMVPGDRLALNHKAEITQEVVDFRVHFDKSIDQFNAELEAGLQSSANRVITQPSAMADAKEAGSQDDDKILGIMEKLARFINHVIIPKILGPDAEGRCQFKWGAQDSFELEFPQGLQLALQAGVVSKLEARMILQDGFRWKLDDKLFQQEKDDTNESKMQDTLAQAGQVQQLQKKNEEKLQKKANEKISQEVLDIIVKYR
jgi:hypothetical protein